MQLLCKALLREVRLQMFFALLLTVGSMILISYFFNENVILTALGLMGFPIGLRFFFRASKEAEIDANHLLLLLNNHPEKIVWVYGLDMQRFPFGFEFMHSGVLYFKLNDGDEISVALPAKKLKLVSRFLNRILTSATFGYTKERAEAYEKNPMALSRGEF